MGGVLEGGPVGVHVQGRGDPEGGVTALAGEGGEPTAQCGEGGLQEVSEGARGEVSGRGEAKGEKVSRVCAYGAAGEGRAPQRAAV